MHGRLGIDLAGSNTPPAQRLEALQKAMDVILEAGEENQGLPAAGRSGGPALLSHPPDAGSQRPRPTSVLVAYQGDDQGPASATRHRRVMNDLDALLDDSIATQGYRIGTSDRRPRP